MPSDLSTFTRDITRLRDLCDSMLKTPMDMVDISEAEMRHWKEQYGEADFILGDFKITKLGKDCV